MEQGVEHRSGTADIGTKGSELSKSRREGRPGKIVVGKRGQIGVTSGGRDRLTPARRSSNPSSPSKRA